MQLKDSMDVKGSLLEKNLRLAFDSKRCWLEKNKLWKTDEIWDANLSFILSRRSNATVNE